MTPRLERPCLRASIALAVVLPLLSAGSFAGGANSPVLIELFTAEGCSSCPPADHFLEQLDTAQPIPGAHLIVLGEHVDYWDHQGWPDPYASKTFTDRQVAYERRLKKSEPFTPQFVVDGTVDMSLSHRDKIKEQLFSAAAAAKVPVSIESLHVVGEGATAALSGTVSVGTAAGARPCELFVAVALDHAETQVLRGENRGQHLTHVAVLRELVRVGPVAPGAASSQPFSIALRPDLVGARLRVIALVQEPDLGAVRGAAEQIVTL